VSLFETIVSIAERSLREKPKKDVVRSLVALRAAMIECQSSYDEYQSLCKEGDYKEVMLERYRIAAQVGTGVSDPKDNWRSSAVHLSILLCELNSVLQIFSPKVYEKISKYTQGELTLEAIDFEAAAREFGEPSDFEFPQATLAPTFKAAVTKLDLFLKETFEIEEIYAAERSLTPLAQRLYERAYGSRRLC